MPIADQQPSRPRVVSAEYSYRRPLGLREMLPAIGVAIGAGLVAFYIARILLQRTPMRVERGGEWGARSGGTLTRTGSRTLERAARR